jgi:hypothetical protein
MRRIAQVALIAVAALASVACGGTTGRQNSLGANGGDPISDATAGADAGSLDGGADADATLGDDSLYTGAFDVVIPYADRALPDVMAVPEGGSAVDVSSGPPSCPPFIPLDQVGRVVSPDKWGNGLPPGYTPIDDAGGTLALDPDGGTVMVRPADEVPADFGGDGGITFALDGSACATWPWLGTVAADECLTRVAQGPSPHALFTAPFLPPCNWAADAGVAVQGSRTGDSRYKICIDLYQCIMRTRCFLGTLGGTNPAPNPGACFCGDLTGNPAGVSDCVVHPHGPCLAEELAGLELPGQDPASQAATAIGEFGRLSPIGPGFAARWLNAIFIALDGHKPIGGGQCVDLTFDRDASGD